MNNTSRYSKQSLSETRLKSWRHHILQRHNQTDKNDQINQLARTPVAEGLGRRVEGWGKGNALGSKARDNKNSDASGHNHVNEIV